MGNYIKDTSQNTCKSQCTGVGKIANSNHTACVCDSNNHWVASGTTCVCDNGYYLNGSSCVAVECGYYSGVGNTRTQCISGWTASKTSTNCNATLGTSEIKNSSANNCKATCSSPKVANSSHTECVCPNSCGTNFTQNADCSCTFKGCPSGQHRKVTYTAPANIVSSSTNSNIMTSSTVKDLNVLQDGQGGIRAISLYTSSNKYREYKLQSDGTFKRSS